MSGPDVEVVVVGGGVIGLAIARALLLRGRDVLLIERNARLGAETSSRNSEVIHAGLYYKPGSLRARLCVEGKSKLLDFAREAGVAFVSCGKILVATSDDDIPILNSIMETARQNGVADLEPLTASQARAMEPELACVAGCLSPSTAVIDTHGLMTALAGHVENLGGAIVLNTSVTAIQQEGGLFEVRTLSGDEPAKITARRVVMAAGLGASALAATMTFPAPYKVPETYYAKGHYFSLSRKSPFEHLVYPMPSGSWLGVHLTRDVAGRARFGPDFEWCPAISYSFENDGGARRERFEREIRRYWPGLPDDALQEDSTGIRPKISRDSSAISDFAIHGEAQHGIQGLVALYGIDSPGLTSSIAIGDYVADALS